MVFVLVLLALMVMFVVSVIHDRDEVSVEDPPGVALAKRNLPEYAELQYKRAQSLERILRDIRAYDSLGTPVLSSQLRERVDEALE